jgi:hypothetical protein
MVIARMTFKEEAADYWIEQPPNSTTVRRVAEVAFEGVAELIAAVKEMEDVLEDCTAIVGSRIVSLADFKV